MKPTSTYKMSKATKTGLALSKFKDAHQRGQWKRAMIDAEITGSFQPKREKTKRGDE